MPSLLLSCWIPFGLPEFHVFSFPRSPGMGATAVGREEVLQAPFILSKQGNKALRRALDEANWTVIINGVRNCLGLPSWKQIDNTVKYFLLEDRKCTGAAWGEAGKGMQTIP